jgi:glycosyltransferase involved in cell wall biosynthesis
MKVLFDYWIMDHVKSGGIYRYYHNLYKEAKLNPSFNIEYKFACIFSESEIDYKNINLVKKPFRNSSNKFLSRSSKISTRIINSSYSYMAANTSSFNIFHPTYYSNSINFNYRKKPVAITVYDMIHELYPSYFKSNDSVTQLKKKCCSKADIIFAISHQTKNDLVKLFDISPDKIKVTYLDGGFENNETTPSSPKNLPSKYILFVGQRSGYKNFDNFLSAITPLLVNDPELFLFCTGPHFTNVEKDKFIMSGISSKVIHHYATDSEFYQIYSNALAFVFPSLYEGFGIPILEAFSAGCPVLASNSSSLAEISEDGAILFDPNSKSEILNATEKLIYNDFLRKSMITKGYQIKQKFSWKKTLTETIDGYKSIL